MLSIHLSKVPLLFKFQQERGCKKAARRVLLPDLSVVPSHGGIHEQSISLLIWSRPQILLTCSFTSKLRGCGIFVIAIFTVARFTSFREVTNLNFLQMSLMISSRPKASVSHCWFMIERQILPFHTNISKVPVLHCRQQSNTGSVPSFARTLRSYCSILE